jgi:hypothetical protein
VRGALA